MRHPIVDGREERAHGDDRHEPGGEPEYGVHGLILGEARFGIVYLSK